MAKYIIQKPIEPANLSGKGRAYFEKNKHRYLLQPKYDGCACAVVVYPAVWAKRPAVFSSTGEVVPMSMERAAEELRVTIGPKLTEPAVFIGEAWMPGTEFKDISGAFRRQKEVSDLLFVVYDVVSFSKTGTFESSLPYIERLERLESLFANRVVVGCVYRVPSFAQAEYGVAPEAYARQMQALGGYDGAMLKDPDGLYFPDRVKMAEAVKVKPLVELDLEVVGVKVDIGEKTGKNTAALEVRLGKDLYCFVSTGLTQAEVDDIVLNYHRDWKGSIIAVEALGYWPSGLLREPRYKGKRHDKVAPDA